TTVTAVSPRTTCSFVTSTPDEWIQKPEPLPPAVFTKTVAALPILAISALVNGSAAAADIENHARSSRSDEARRGMRPMRISVKEKSAETKPGVLASLEVAACLV